MGLLKLIPSLILLGITIEERMSKPAKKQVKKEPAPQLPENVIAVDFIRKVRV